MDRYQYQHPEPQLPPPEERQIPSNASSLEWNLVMGFTFMVELAQLVLNFLAIGLALNRAISVGMGIMMTWWMLTRGGGLHNPKRIISMVATFGAEEVPVLDSLFFWTGELALLRWVLK